MEFLYVREQSVRVLKPSPRCFQFRRRRRALLLIRAVQTRESLAWSGPKVTLQGPARVETRPFRAPRDSGTEIRSRAIVPTSRGVVPIAPHDASVAEVTLEVSLALSASQRYLVPVSDLLVRLYRCVLRCGVDSLPAPAILPRLGIRALVGGLQSPDGPALRCELLGRQRMHRQEAMPRLRCPQKCNAAAPRPALLI